jgi:hypothetical protein
MKKQIAVLEARIKDLEAYCGVLSPVFEREYKKGGWNWEADKPNKSARKAR